MRKHQPSRADTWRAAYRAALNYLSSVVEDESVPHRRRDSIAEFLVKVSDPDTRALMRLQVLMEALRD
jgi:uncharacterized protein (UPF0147 family)